MARPCMVVAVPWILFTRNNYLRSTRWNSNEALRLSVALQHDATCKSTRFTRVRSLLPNATIQCFHEREIENAWNKKTVHDIGRVRNALLLYGPQWAAKPPICQYFWWFFCDDRRYRIYCSCSIAWLPVRLAVTAGLGVPLLPWVIAPPFEIARASCQRFLAKGQPRCTLKVQMIYV